MNASDLNAAMLSTEVPSLMNKSILGEEKNSLSSFYAIMKSVQDLRVIVILIAVGHAVYKLVHSTSIPMNINSNEKFLLIQL